MERRRWSRDELVKVLSLYCQIPFGKMHARNPAVILLAEAISRTPAAVAMKLVNFASLDPSLKKRGIAGLHNTSENDRSVWEEYYGHWDVLADSVVIDASVYLEPDQVAENGGRPSSPAKTTEVVRESAQRRGQQFFRSAVLAAHCGKCCITGISSEPLLRASHIVPWACDSSLRLDPSNGLCLNALHDAAFDRGFITLSDSYELCLSSRLEACIPRDIYCDMFASYASKPVAMPERFYPSSEALEYHRVHVFKKS